MTTEVEVVEQPLPPVAPHADRVERPVTIDQARAVEALDRLEVFHALGRRLAQIRVVVNYVNIFA